ncbi:MAG: DUF1232 domain-containing protein [Alphaproteobacteria bacterium]|nr:MAG: DUF1232 domain-containing protein [Alphaproteobacteria bacterium]
MEQQQEQKIQETTPEKSDVAQAEQAPEQQPEQSAEQSEEAVPKTRIDRLLRRVRNDILTVYLIGKDRRLSTGLKIFALCILSYALSPVDLIPDFIPVIGYLDDILLLVPAVYILYAMIPPEILEELKLKARNAKIEVSKKQKMGAVMFVVTLWTIGAAWIFFMFVL